MSTWLMERAVSALERRTSRRGFLARTAVVGSALAVNPLDYVLHPGTAYAALCRCGSAGCGCGSACCDGYTEFCCTMTGSNTCPPGTVAGGWWRADGSTYCGGAPRYYIDCHGECPAATGPPGFCAGQDGLACGCAFGSCANRVTGCVTFRYGQCHQDIPQMGRIACRVVTCTPAYLVDNACSNQTLLDNATAEHNRPCLQAPAVVRRTYGSASTADGTGLWLTGLDGGVFAYGSAGYFGSMGGRLLDAPMVGIAATPTGKGYWTVASDGGIFAFGDAGYFDSMGGRLLDAPMVGIAATPTGKGYWTVASDGGIFAFGDAEFSGSTGSILLTEPIVGMAATPTGDGYWLVASDGGVFAFGDAAYRGSAAGQALDSVIGGLVPTATGLGYWLWGQDGSVRAFGDAPDLGDYPRLAAADRQLPSGGVDAFYAMTVRTAEAPGYVLWASSPLGPPPTPRSYGFAGAVPVPTPA